MLGQKRRIVADINMVPYIDVMLVLLVIFMATATFTISGLQLDLPESSTNNIPANTHNSCVISISKIGEYSITQAQQSHQNIPVSKVVEIVKVVFKSNPNMNVLINGDKQADYVYLINLLDALQTIGVSNIGFITVPHATKTYTS